MLCWKKKGGHHYIIIFVCCLNVVAEKSIRCVIIYYFAPPDFKHEQKLSRDPRERNLESSSSNNVNDVG